MISAIAPRLVHFRDRDGFVGDIIIEMCPLPDTIIRFSDAPDIQIFNAEIMVKSNVIQHVMRAEGLDEIQLIYRLLWSADVFIQTRFRQAGLEVFKIRPGDVEGPMDIYN